MQGAHEFRQQRPRILSCTHHEAEIAIAGLIDREILRRPRPHIQRSFANIVHHADNLPRRRTPHLFFADPLANRVLARKILPRQRLVDHHHSRPGSIVVLGEESSTNQPGPECCQILWAYVALVHLVMLTVVWLSWEL